MTERFYVTRRQFADTPSKFDPVVAPTLPTSGLVYDLRDNDAVDRPIMHTSKDGMYLNGLATRWNGLDLGHASHSGKRA